jgi:RND family efflux transporter MFP subunit
MRLKQMRSFQWIAGLLVLATGLSSCSKKDTAAVENQAIAVVVETVKTGNIEQTITLTGELRPMTYVQMSPKISGRLQRLSLDDGTIVKENVWVQKGQVVAVLEHDDLDAQLQRAKAAVQTAEAMVTQANVDIEDKLRDKGRMENLFKEGSATEKQRDTAVTVYEFTKAGVQSAEARLSEARAALNQTQITLEESFLKSPLTGVISKKFADEGDMVGPAGPVVAVLPMETLKFLIEVPTQYLATIDPNKTEIRLKVDAWPDKTFTAKVEKIYPAINPQTRTFTIELSVPNEKGADEMYLLRPGMYATARVVLDRQENAVLVPADSLVRLSGKYLAYGVENNIARRKDIEIGLWSGSMIQVKSGLKAGDQLVVNGQHKLTDNTPVEIIKSVQQEGDKQ